MKGDTPSLDYAGFPQIKPWTRNLELQIIQGNSILLRERVRRQETLGLSMQKLKIIDLSDRDSEVNMFKWLMTQISIPEVFYM